MAKFAHQYMIQMIQTALVVYEQETYSMPEATPEFKQQLRTAFDSIVEGQIFTFQRTFTEGDVALFCGVTGD